VPLILFGGTVTTLRAGMAEDGWLAPDGYLLWLYPLELRLRSAGVFVEHHHREIGSLVGFLAIGLVVSTLRCDRRRGARGLALATLAAIALQGTIGGLRVLENDPDLAFLHGALAHAVFALIGANACLAAADWRTAPRAVHAGAEALARATLAGVLVVYAQIVAGAWLRHSGAPAALALHLVLAAAVLFEVLRAARGLAEAGEEHLTRAARRLRWLVGVQLFLGAGAALGVYGYSGGFEGQVSGTELVFATLHVLVGALLLWQALAAALWTRRLLEPAPAALVAGVPSWEGAR
jgi:cytochrome c oxidase assembly protein subunit 15